MNQSVRTPATEACLRGQPFLSRSSFPRSHHVQVLKFFAVSLALGFTLAACGPEDDQHQHLELADV